MKVAYKPGNLFVSAFFEDTASDPLHCKVSKLPVSHFEKQGYLILSSDEANKLITDEFVNLIQIWEEIPLQEFDEKSSDSSVVDFVANDDYAVFKFTEPYSGEYIHHFIKIRNRSFKGLRHRKTPHSDLICSLIKNL